MAASVYRGVMHLYSAVPTGELDLLALEVLTQETAAFGAQHSLEHHLIRGKGSSGYSCAQALKPATVLGL